MQRVRIGLTGLACVFLLVIFAAAFLGFVGGDVHRGPATKNATSAPGTPAGTSVAETPKEPLAELGVAPGNEPQKSDDQPIK